MTDALDLRISEMDLEPDRDGRFRVNDFFCHEDTWQMALSRLEGDSDAVLMDLRGFSAQNTGVAYEISELVNVVPFERVAFVIDETTNEGLLEQTLQESWDRISPTSPNRSSTLGRITLFRFRGPQDGELRRFLRVLAGAAKPTVSEDVDRLPSILWPVPAALVALFVIVTVVLVSGGSAMFGRDLLFWDDFSVANKWPEDRGKYFGSYYGPSLVESVSGNNSYYMYASPNWAMSETAPKVGPVRDATVEVIVTLTRGYPYATSAGVVCRVRDENNYYVLSSFFNGYASIEKFKDGKNVQLAGARYGEAAGGGISIGGRGTTLEIRGDCVGDKLTLYVDGQKVVETEDSEFEVGKVGPLLWSSTVEGRAARAEGSFDNFEVYTPQ